MCTAPPPRRTTAAVDTSAPHRATTRYLRTAPRHHRAAGEALWCSLHRKIKEVLSARKVSMYKKMKLYTVMHHRQESVATL